ncbi:MAG TPA: lysophospholipid acyltransferase family protein [Anaeromyxobacteraceae bacterium]|nr:lysophospholipid acyltransferase family protein [Anaeromyxobacteraceae bacterium]
MLLRIFSIAYWIFAVITMVPFFLAAAVIRIVTFPFDRRRIVQHLWSCVWAQFYVWTNPLWSNRVTGREKLPWNGAAVLVANHASILDIMVMYALYRPFKWVAKAELMRTPFIGWNMRLNDYVSVRRGDRESIVRMMNDCRRHLAAGSPLMIFPEGTRSTTGVMGSFKDGAFKLAREAGCPVFPIAVRGTGESMPKHGIVLRKRMDALVQVLDPLDSREYASNEALREAARQRIAAALAEPPP